MTGTFPNTDEPDLECQLQQTITVFRLLDNKDAFEEFYSKMMSKQLVHRMSVSDEADESMIFEVKRGVWLPVHPKVTANV